MDKILLVGGGGHCKSVLDTLFELNTYNIEGILDTPEKVGQYISGVKVIGTDDDLLEYFNEGIKCAFITVGSIGDTSIRVKLYKKLKAIGYKLPVIVDKSSIVSKHALIDEGSFIGKGAIVNIDASIGRMCIINSGVIVEHDCKVGKFVHIAPGATLSGGVVIEDNVHIGTNSTIIQYKKIGENSLIGAGSIVTKDVAANIKAYGNPCREV